MQGLLHEDDRLTRQANAKGVAAVSESTKHEIPECLAGLRPYGVAAAWQAADFAADSVNQIGVLKGDIEKNFRPLIAALAEINEIS